MLRPWCQCQMIYEAVYTLTMQWWYSLTMTTVGGFSGHTTNTTNTMFVELSPGAETQFVKVARDNYIILCDTRDKSYMCLDNDIRGAHTVTSWHSANYRDKRDLYQTQGLVTSLTHWSLHIHNSSTNYQFRTF